MAYADELDAMTTLEQELRRKIALRIAEERGSLSDSAPPAAWTLAADEAIAAWEREGEDEQDMRAFRPLGPLQELLADHRDICERIVDMHDRRLS